MKKIIVICLTISAIIGTYEHSKIETKSDLAQQVAITIAGSEIDTVQHQSVQLERPRDPTPTPPASRRIPATVYAAEDHPSDEAIIRGKKNGEILWRVYALESTRGKNDGCREKGKFNGFGYRQNTREHVCYDYFEEVAYHVDAWFTEKMETHSLAEALCGYNLGFQSPNLKECVAQSDAYPYYKNYLSL